jgi:TonB family protein
MMKRTLIIIFLFTGFSYAQQRYDQGKTVCPNDTLTFLKFDMIPVNGIVYNEFGDLGLFENGKPEGLHKRWYANGQLKSEIHYKNGQYHGSRKQYFSNGKISSIGNFKYNLLNGCNREYNINGNLVSEFDYLDGEKNDISRVWNDEGLLLFEYKYKDGKPNGSHRGWYKNRQLMYEFNYLDGRDSVQKIWYDNGQLMCIIKNDQEQSEKNCKMWLKNGDLFYHGKLKDEWTIFTCPFENFNLATVQHLEFLIANGMHQEETENAVKALYDEQIWAEAEYDVYDEPIWVEVEAEYDGGYEKLNEFINDNILYPEEALVLGVKGRVIVRFIVEKDGTVSNAVVETKLDECPACDKEALRLVSIMPNWKPASNAGRIVRTYVRLPIRFGVD